MAQSVRWRGRTAEFLDDPAKVRPHPENPNNGDVDEIANSVIELGVYRPIYASTRSGYIVAGHHLYLALVDNLGQPQVPIEWDYYTEEEERRLMLADNDVAARAWVDPGLKLSLLQSLVNTPSGLRGTGSTFETVSNLLAEAKRPFVPGTVEDDTAVGQMATCPNCNHTFPVRIDL